MFLHDLSSVFTWWSVLFLTGAIFFPFTRPFFSRFVDNGYIFSKIIGILLTSYLVWLLGILKILPFSQASILLILSFFLLGNIFFLWLQDKSNPDKTKSKINLILIIIGEELMFFLALLIWSFVKAHQPDINSLEKFMDFGFINSILRADYFPPLDMWLAKSPVYPGYFINYYYFGHLVTAVLTMLSGINASVTYNLMLATIFAFTFTGSFSIAINLINNEWQAKNKGDNASFVRPFLLFKKVLARRALAGPIFFALLTALLVSLAGNLHTIYAFFKPYVPADKPVPFWQLPWDFHLLAYWYPNATRFIPYTIHEFPSYSFVVSDLHGHVLDIPFVLLTIALLLNYLITKQSNNRTIEQSNNFIFLPVLSLSLAAMYMTNAWDGLIYFGLSALVIGFVIVKNNHYKNILTSYFLLFTLYLLPLFLLFIVFSLPFQLTFKPFVSGIGIAKDHSPLWMLAILWGFFYYCAAGFIVILVKQFNNRTIQQSNNLKNDTFITKMFNCFSPSDIFVLLLIIISTGLLIFPELFYVKDIYPQHYRANTMFKLGYQAFIMLSLSSGYIISRLFSKKFSKFNPFFTFYLLLLTLFICLVLLYPYFSTNTYFNGLKNYKGLNGLSYMTENNTSDYQVILWFQNNVKGQPVTLEAVGDSYTEYSRISANTGLPTVLGWPVHEWLWRGGYDEPGRRVEEVKKAYLTTDLEETKSFLKKYNVQYVVFGDKERQKYSEVKEDKWLKLGTVIFASGSTKVYKIN